MISRQRLILTEAAGEYSAVDRCWAARAGFLAATARAAAVLCCSKSVAPAAAGRAAAHHNVVVAVAQTDSYAAAAPDNSAAAADNFSAAAIRNSVEAVIDNCVAAQSNCVPVGTGSGAGLQAGWISVAGAAPDASVATGWAPGGKNAAENRCDDSARGTALPLKPAS